MTKSPASVFLVDDDEAVRDAICLILSKENYSVTCFGSAEAFMAAYAPGTPGCLILDLRMPGISGLELQQWLNDRQIPLPIIFLSAHGDIRVSVKTIKAGAVDFLPKPFERKELLARVEEALALDRTRRVEEAGQEQIERRYQRLTRREREVMAHMVAGLTSKEIARELDVSYRTVEKHRGRVLEKMEVNSMAQLVSQALTCGRREWSP